MAVREGNLCLRYRRCKPDFIPTFNSCFLDPGIHRGGQDSYAFIFTAFSCSPGANTPLSLSSFFVPAKGEVVTLHMGTSVILSAGDNKKEAPLAEVAVPDTKLGAVPPHDTIPWFVFLTGAGGEAEELIFPITDVSKLMNKITS